MADPKELKHASDILFSLVTDEVAKTRWGMVQREELKKALEAGQAAIGYRADWLDTTAKGILQLLGERAQGFNVAYPHDRISKVDLIDALNTASIRIQKS